MFLPEDTEYALRWQAELDLLCSGCGHPKDESMDPANEGSYEASARRCHACTEQALKSSAWADSSAADRGGLYLSVRKRGASGD
jgi:hypothetical protein